MMQSDSLQQLAAECEQELISHILPFWMRLRDPRGGFYGQMDGALKLHPDAPKGVILHARLLWAFSSAYLRFPNPEYLDAAQHAYDFIRQAWDVENGGLYWSLTPDCKPFETDKYAYCNAFGIYGLCAYAEASGNAEAFDLAERIFQQIETHFAEQIGYTEALTADWNLLENDHLSEHDLHAAKTMNTVLHLIEAYAELYRLRGGSKVGDALKRLLMLMADTVYQPEREMLDVFFDTDMQSLCDLHSYGHDIEASWLIDHACDCLGDAALTERFRAVNYTLAKHVHAVAFRDGALDNERFEAEIDRTRVWWVQAEGIIGFLNAAQTAEQLYQDTEASARFADSAAALWDFVKVHQIDRRQGGEWYGELDTDGNPRMDQDMAGLWKCPYHNSRMCLEVIRRIQDR